MTAVSQRLTFGLLSITHAVIPTRASAAVASLLALTAILTAPSTLAWEGSVNMVLGSEYSDNIGRASSGNEQDEIETRVGTEVTLSHDSETFELDLDYDANYSDFKNNEIETDSEVVGTSTALWRILDERIKWNFRHLITETLANNREVDTPDNRETRQILTTGPEFTARLTKVDNLNLSVSYTQVNQDDAANTDPGDRTNIDSERGQAGLTWSHALSRTSDFNVGYSQSVTEFDDDSPDFEYQQLFIGYNARLASGEYNIRVGANRAERENLNNEEDGVFTSINYNRDFEGRRLAISAIRQLTDSSIGLGADGADVTNSNFDDIDIVERTNIIITYGYDNVCRGCAWDISYIYDEEDFQQDNLQTTEFVQDSKEHSILSTLAYRVNSRLTARTAIEYSEIDFRTENRQDESVSIELGVDWTVADRLSLSFITVYDTRDTTRDNDPIDLDYDELTFGVTANYQVY